MLVRLSHARLDRLLPVLQLGLLAYLFRGGNGPADAAALIVLLLSALYGWASALRHARLIADTPTSRIGSAAQGYVELRGRAQPLASGSLHSLVDGLPLLWYRLQIEERQQNRKWRTIHTTTSDTSFMLEDDSGHCAVNPDGAEMLVRRRDITVRGDRRYTQWSLLRHDPVYVLGEFSTLGSHHADFDSHAAVGALLTSWKQDPDQLLERFDLDGNGELDLREWELARRAAKREVLQQQEKILAAPEAHLVRKPKQQALYLISDLDPKQIGRRYFALACFHGVLFIASAATMAWLNQQGLF